MNENKGHVIGSILGGNTPRQAMISILIKHVIT